MYTNYKSSAYNSSLTLNPCRLCSRDECQFPSTCQGDPWKCLLLLVQAADRNMYKHRKENLDRYFQYGIILFTCNATVLWDSYKWVTKNTPYSYIFRFCVGNLTHQPPDNDGAVFIPNNAAVTIVALWAVSLVSISASLLMCHLSYQWLREFVNSPQFSYKNQLAFRQIRYDSLCRRGLFNICDIIPILLPLSVTLSTVGLVMFLSQLNHPDAYVFLGVSCVLFVYYFIVALHPLYCFLKAPQNSLTSELSPFRSPSSWFFFKLGNWLIFIFMNLFNFTSYWMQRNGRRALLELHPSRRAILPQFRPPTRTKSIDWLEQDCSLFMQADNAQDVNTPLINALIWIDSNPTIEKTTKVVVSVYRCISDLHLPSILPRFMETCTGPASPLAGIITAASQEFIDVNDPAATAFVLKSWLELHVTRLPELRTQLAELQFHCINEIGKRMDYARLGFNSINAFLIQGRRLPVKIAHSLLATARTGLANSIYYEGTFELIFQVIFQYRDSASERQVNLVLAVLAECKHFAYSFRGSGLDEQQARQFMSELGEFLSNVQAIDCDFDPPGDHRSWSPRSNDTWKEVITIANQVHFIANDDPLYDGACPVSTTESFDSRQFGTNDAGVESDTKTFTTWSMDAGSFEPEAFTIHFKDADTHCVLKHTWTSSHSFTKKARRSILPFDNSTRTHRTDSSALTSV
ncbi:hypothetical protein JOM56_000602 [Amanita muscaria]